MAERTLRARLEAETSAFSSRMAAAEAQLQRMDRAPRVAARGMGMLNSSLQQLAFQATGVGGPIGRAVAAVGLLGVGSLAVTAFLGGVGAMVLLLKDFRRGADEAAKAAEEAEKRIAALLVAGKPSAAAMQAQQAKGAELELAREALSGTIAKQVIAQQAGLLISAAKFANQAKEQRRLVELLQREYDLLVDKAKTAHQATADAGAREAEALAKARFEAAGLRRELILVMRAAMGITPTRRLQMELQGFQGLFPGLRPEMAGIPGRAATMPGLLPGLPGTTAAALKEMASREDQLGQRAQQELDLREVQIAIQEQENSARARSVASLNQYAASVELTAARQEQAVAIAIMGIGSLVQGLIGGGGAGGFFGGLLSLAGSVASVLPGGQVIGAGLMAGGGIVSAIAARGQREELPVVDRQVRAELRGLRNEIREILVSETVVTGNPGSVRDIDLARQRLVRRGVVTHFPRGG